jgi:methylated-DNA-[protein]-cysteine S-methyltransferase
MATATLAPTLYTTLDSPLGELVLAGDREAVTRLGFGRPAAARAWERDDERFAGVAAQLVEYFAGGRREFDLALRMAGSPFERRVWRELQAIPYGRTASYGEIARRVGRPDAARAVGVANARNPVAIVVPCHRVIGANGSLTGYAGGLDRKRALLDRERGGGRRLS